MTYTHKRQYVSNLYNGFGWKKRVEKMRDDEITAIYLKHIQGGMMPARLESDDEEEAPHLDIDIPPKPPHENEDDFPIY